jgi:hypothetical protein
MIALEEFEQEARDKYFDQFWDDEVRHVAKRARSLGVTIALDVLEHYTYPQWQATHLLIWTLENRELQWADDKLREELESIFIGCLKPWPKPKVLKKPRLSRKRLSSSPQNSSLQQRALQGALFRSRDDCLGGMRLEPEVIAPAPGRDGEVIDGFRHLTQSRV